MSEVRTLIFRDERSKRYQENKSKIKSALLDGNKKLFISLVNIKEFERFMDEHEFISFEDVVSYVTIPHPTRNYVHRDMLISSVVKDPSRQGALDEKLQIKVCADVGKEHGIIISQLTNVQLTPSKDGRILTLGDVRRENLQRPGKLKTFDAKISGKLDGYITAKVCIGTGGHQDNVFDEIVSMGNWFIEFQRPETLVILYDNDFKIDRKTELLKKTFENTKNVMSFNHVEFQKFLQMF